MARQRVGSGYFIRIRASEPLSRIYARCSKGTTCVVPRTLRIHPGEEWEWVVELMTRRGGRVVGGFLVCIVGSASTS